MFFRNWNSLSLYSRCFSHIFNKKYFNKFNAMIRLRILMKKLSFSIQI